MKLPGKLLRSPFSYTSLEVDPLVPLPTKSFQSTAQKNKLFTKGFFSQCKCSFLRIYLHLLKKLLAENFVVCAVKLLAEETHGGKLRCLCIEATCNFSLKLYLWSAFIKVFFIIKDTLGQVNSSISKSQLLSFFMVKITKWYKNLIGIILNIFYMFLFTLFTMHCFLTSFFIPFFGIFEKNKLSLTFGIFSRTYKGKICIRQWICNSWLVIGTLVDER